MQLRKTILALLVLVVVGGFAYYLSREPQPQKSHKLFQMASADIQKIELSGPARDLVIVRSGPGLWRIVRPVDAAADNAAVDGLAGAIADLEVVDSLGDHAGDLANFGLENPAVTVTVTTKDKHVLPGIIVGSDTPIGGNTYIKTTDQPAVMLIASGFTSQANRTLNELRSRVLIDLTADQMHRVTVTHADGTQIEVAREAGAWKILKPREVPADKDAVQALLDTIATAQVSDFIEDHPGDLEKFGLAKPRLVIEVDGGNDNAKDWLEIGNKQTDPGKDADYARTSGSERPVCTVADYIVKGLDRSLDDLRDKTVLAFDETKVTRMTLIGGPVSIVVERASAGKWNVIAEGRTAPAQPEVVASLIGQLHDLKGSRIVADPMIDPQPYGMTQPNLSTVFYDQDGKEIGNVDVSQVETNMPPNPMTGKSSTRKTAYATSSASKAVYVIQSDQVINLENTAETLKHNAQPQSASGSPSSPASSAASPVASMPPVAAAPTH